MIIDKVLPLWTIEDRDKIRAIDDEEDSLFHRLMEVKSFIDLADSPSWKGTQEEREARGHG